MANDFGNDFEIANMSDPINDYNFKGKINIITWEDIDRNDLYDIYNVPKKPLSGINIAKLERYVVP